MVLNQLSIFLENKAGRLADATAAIAGAGPLVGPVLAAQFGYLPGLLWIVFGVVLGGAVQDFVILSASMRRDGDSWLVELGFPARGKYQVVISGKPSASAAGAWAGLASTTVRFHLDNVARKLGASNRTHAVAIAVQLGLLGPIGA